MPSLQDVLGGLPPVYGAYAAARGLREQSGMRDLQRASTLVNLQSVLQQQAQREAGVQEEARIKATLQGAKTPQEAIDRLLATGNPKAIEIAGKLKGLLPPPKQFRSIGAGGAVDEQGNMIAPMARPETPKAPQTRKIRRGEQEVTEEWTGTGWREVGSGPAFAKQVAPTFVTPKVEPPIQTHTDKDGNLWERERGGNWRRAMGFDQSQPGEVSTPLSSRTPASAGARPLTPYGKLNEDFKAGRITSEQYNSELQRMGAGSKAPDDVIRAISEGRMSLPSGFALRSPYWQDVIERVAKINPQFDAGIYGARAAARRTFASGPEARNVTAMNTLIGHLGTLDEAMQALENKDLRVYNMILNRARKELGDPRISSFETAREAVASEAVRVFRVVGMSTLEQQEWKNILTTSGSPSQMRANIKTLGDLLEKRIEAVAQQFERTVGTGGNPAMVDPKNKQLLDRMRTPSSGSGGGWSIRPK